MGCELEGGGGGDTEEVFVIVACPQLSFVWATGG